METMETEEEAQLVLPKSILSDEEWKQIPETVVKKLVEKLTESFEKYMNCKALYESRRVDSEQQISATVKELKDVKTRLEEATSQLETANNFTLELEKQLSVCTEQSNKFQEQRNQLEKQTAELRRERDLAVDERDSSLKLIDRRNSEIERLQADAATLMSQLKMATETKCEALAKAEEVASTKVNLEFRERRMEQEKSFLNGQIMNLTESLNKRDSEMANLRQDHTSRLIILDTKLNKKTEELRIANDTIASLTAANKTMTGKCEEMTERLAQNRETELKLEESFANEMQAQKKLADLYKGMAEENTQQVEELKKGMAELQNLLYTATEQYGELETKHHEMETEHEEVLAKKTECITMLKRELEVANEQVERAREEVYHRDMEMLSPAAAAASRLLKPDVSFTEVLRRYNSLNEQLSHEKEENRRLTSYFQTVMQEMDERMPNIQKEREEYQQAMSSIQELTKQNDEMIVECARWKEQATEAAQNEARVVRDNSRLKKEVADLSRQVCYLLKEVEAARGGTSPEHETCSDEKEHLAEGIIAKKLVTFKDIDELQSINLKLLSTVRELSSKREGEEEMGAKGVALKEQLQKLQEEHRETLEMQADQARMLQTVSRQRDLYRNMCLKRGLKTDNDDDEQPAAKKVAVAEADTDKLKKTEEDLQELDQKYKQVKEEHETYRIEKAANEKLLAEQLERTSARVQELIQTNCRLATQAEYSEDKYKVLRENVETYKKQIQALEDKNRAYSTTIVKHEQSLMHLKDEALSAQSKLARAEVQLQNLQQERQLLRDSESRLLKEKELTERGAQCQGLLLSNLEMIKASLERSEAEGRARIEGQLDNCMRECSALRRRLQEEQDKHRELSIHVERQAVTATKRAEELAQEAERLRSDLEETRKDQAETAAKLEEASRKAKEIRLSSATASDDARVRTLELRIKDHEATEEALRSQLQTMRDSLKQFSDIAELAEKRVAEEHEDFEAKRAESDKRVTAAEAEAAIAKERIGELEAELSLLSDGRQETAHELDNQLSRARHVAEELRETRSRLEEAQKELEMLRVQATTAEDKYTREMVAHSEDLQILTSCKEELTSTKDKISLMTVERDSANKTLESQASVWADREAELLKQKEQVENRLEDLDKQNSALLDQIQELSSKLSLVHARDVPSDGGGDATDVGANGSGEQLLQVIKYLRREKDLAITKFEVLQAENARIRSQIELLEKQLKEAREALASERETSEVSVVTAAKHAEILRKVETLNAITDSNRILREERDSLRTRLNEVAGRAAKLEEQLAPLQEANRELSGRSETALAENAALKAEATRWRQRANSLIEKANKVSPEDWRRLQSDRENLAKMLSAEKENLKRLQEEKNRNDEQLLSLRQLGANQAKEVKRLAEEIAVLKQQSQKTAQELAEAREAAAKKTEENARITEDLAAKDVQLADIRAKETQVRKIAKKYKTQYEELLAKQPTEEEREEKEQAEKVDPDRYREEGRREADGRIAELERQHDEKLTELNARVTSSAEENEKLKRENSDLRSNEGEKDERTKIILKAAKNKITELTDERNRLRRELAEVRTRLEASSDERVSRLEKEKTDLQTERDRLMRELEALNTRIRQLGGATADKPGPDPPTANIKPMGSSPGPQQSATVMPWRGSETPFASIRPMSQLRTVAVPPTAVGGQSSSSAPAAVLVPPQQQVHTTAGAEAMSSPTSSHTDYMPATSSASSASSQPQPQTQPLKQLAVPPTQQATIDNSTQDGERVEAGDEVVQQPPQASTAPQQTVAMVSPRVELADGPSGTASVQPSEQPSSAASAAAGGSNAVTTSQGQGHKRPRDVEGDRDEEPRGGGGKNQPHSKKTRRQHDAMSAPAASSDVEYQVPTSSQRDQEDDVIVLSDQEEEEDEDDPDPDPDDGPDEGESGGGNYEDGADNDDNDADAEQELNYDDGVDQVDPDNEVEVVERDESRGGQVSQAPVAAPPAPQSEAISSGSSEMRARTVTPLLRGGTNPTNAVLYDEAGDDGIVPSTPTLYVPRRTDGYGEPVSSPHVPARFTFGEGPSSGGAAEAAPTPEAAPAVLPQDTSSLQQLDDSGGTGRSVPGTPQQVSPQADQPLAGQGDDAPPPGNDPPEQRDEQAPASEVAVVDDDESAPPDDDAAGDAAADDDVELLDGDDPGDGVTSEGEKPQSMEESEVEEGREAEASVSTRRTRSSLTPRGSGTARRSSRIAFRNSRASSHRPTPIVWTDGQQHSSPNTRNAQMFGGPARGSRGRRMRQMRGSPFNRF